MNFVTLKHPYKSVNLRRRKYQRALNLVRRNVWRRSLKTRAVTLSNLPKHLECLVLCTVNIDMLS